MNAVLAEPVETVLLAEPRARRPVDDLGGRIALARLERVVVLQPEGVVQQPVHVAENADAVGDLLHDLLRIPDLSGRRDATGSRICQ